MLVLSTRIVLDLFYLLIFHSEKFSTDVCRLPYAVNVNLNLSISRELTLGTANVLQYLITSFLIERIQTKFSARTNCISLNPILLPLHPYTSTLIDI